MLTVIGMVSTAAAQGGPAAKEPLPISPLLRQDSPRQRQRRVAAVVGGLHGKSVLPLLVTHLIQAP